MDRSETASDVHLGLSLDQVPNGWIIKNHQHVQPLTIKLLEKKPVSIIADLPQNFLQKADFNVAFGQAAGAIHEIKPAAEIVEELMNGLMNSFKQVQSHM